MVWYCLQPDHCSWFHACMALGECSLLFLCKAKAIFVLLVGLGFFFYKHCVISISVPIDLSFFSNWTISQYSNHDHNKKCNKADQPE